MKPTRRALGQGYHLDITTPTEEQKAIWTELQKVKSNLTFGFQCSLVCSECGAILEILSDDRCPGGGYVKGLLEVQTRVIFVKPCSCLKSNSPDGKHYRKEVL